MGYKDMFLSEYCISALKRKRVTLWLVYVQALGLSERGARRASSFKAKNPSKEVKRTSLTPCLLKGLTPAGCP